MNRLETEHDAAANAWRVDKFAGDTRVGTGETPVSSTAPASSAEEAEKAVRAAFAHVLSAKET
jgi:hypothetical protein